MDLVITGDKIFISKKSTDSKSWKDILLFYKSSKTFNSNLELEEYLQVNYHLSSLEIEKINKGLSDITTHAFELIFSTDGIPFQVKELNINIGSSESKPQRICEEEWFYTLDKAVDGFFLFVYLGGICEQIRIIKLSDSQVEAFQNSGKSFVKELAVDIWRQNSQVFKEAIRENRRVV